MQRLCVEGREDGSRVKSKAIQDWTLVVSIKDVRRTNYTYFGWLGTDKYAKGMRVSGSKHSKAGR